MTSEDLKGIAETERENQRQYAHNINVCMAAGCLSQRSDQVKTAIEQEVAVRGLEKQCKVRCAGCMGLCAAGPLITVDNERRMYRDVSAADAPEIVQSLDSAPVQRLVLDTTMPFFTRQKRVVLENSGRIDPERIEEYIAADGYAALYEALTSMGPPEVIEQVTRSGLRGRGGAGFPTGLKWNTVSKALGPQKYVICNADEGDPGAFMDRSVLESDPHRVIEGMTLAAYAVGASEGYIYVRAEYPLAVARLKTAIKQAEKLGLLGANIFGSTFDFKISIRLGAGAFVCGEETALIASIEGNRGIPRPRPPYPAERGLWDCPTLINNVETFANIPPIVRNDGDWFAGIGTEKSKGTKVFAIAGRVKNTGLIEVPMGIPLRDIVFEIGGGIPNDGELKAVQTGGPSGGCIPIQYLDMPVDYESLAEVGSIMGSGGMIIMDQTSCMVDVARFFTEFTMTESCGQCIPCRVGTAQMHDMLARITRGDGLAEDMSLLQDLADVMKSTSLCGLGQSSPNPVLTTMRYFKDEYLAHIHDKRCPAGSCPIHASKPSLEEAVR